MTFMPRPAHFPTNGASGPSGLATCGNGCRVAFSMGGSGWKEKSGDRSMKSPTSKSGLYEEALATSVRKPTFDPCACLVKDRTSQSGRAAATCSLDKPAAGRLDGDNTGPVGNKGGPWPRRPSTQYRL